MPHTRLQVQALDFAWPNGPSWCGWGAQLSPGVTALVGGESSGKTTVLRLLAAELRPTGGQLTLNGAQAWGDGAQANPAYRSQVFWCDPASTEHDALTGHGYLAMQQARCMAGPTTGWQADALAGHLEGLALLQHLDKPLYALSTGTRRKLRWAAAFASGAALTLLDDPFAALDRASINHVLETLDELSDSAYRVVVVAGYEPPPGVPLVGTISL